MKLSEEERDNAYMSNLQPDVKTEIEAVRKIIKMPAPNSMKELNGMQPAIFSCTTSLRLDPIKLKRFACISSPFCSKNKVNTIRRRL